MKTPFKIFLPLLITLFGHNSAKAQKGDNFVKLGSTLFFLADAQKINHGFASLGASYEYKFSGVFSASFNANAARLISSISAENAYIKNINSLEAEARFYPNLKGKGFYAGASLVWYQDKKKIGALLEKSSHWGSHINIGVQLPLENNFYWQANAQIGIYGEGFSTISRYGLNAMVGKRF